MPRPGDARGGASMGGGDARGQPEGVPCAGHCRDHMRLRRTKSVSDGRANNPCRLVVVHRVTQAPHYCFQYI